MQFHGKSLPFDAPLASPLLPPLLPFRAPPTPDYFPQNTQSGSDHVYYCLSDTTVIIVLNTDNTVRANTHT